MPIERKKTLNVFKDARDAWGSYDDFPVGQPGTDPMPHLSRNRVTQPFYLVSEADQVLIQMAGRGEILFRDVDASDPDERGGNVTAAGDVDEMSSALRRRNSTNAAVRTTSELITVARRMEPGVTRFVLEPGDTVYIPACVPSRLIPDGENVQIRLKAEPAVREAVAWYCVCGALVSSEELAPGIVQGAYLAAVQRFNASARRCAACERVHPAAELGDIDWAAVAAAVRASL
jgi:hypothetical protein